MARFEIADEIRARRAAVRGDQAANAMFLLREGLIEQTPALAA